MSLDNSKIPKLNDSSRKFITKQKRKSLNDPFVERTEKGKKVSGTMMIQTRIQKASEDEREKLDEKILHPNPALDENRVGCGKEGKENSRLRSVFTPVEQDLMRTGFLD